MALFPDNAENERNLCRLRDAEGNEVKFGHLCCVRIAWDKSADSLDHNLRDKGFPIRDVPAIVSLGYNQFNLAVAHRNPIPRRTRGN